MSARGPPRRETPLPLIREPFRRIAMDIVGSGKRVICDYATRYPEAIPMRSVHVAEELLSVLLKVWCTSRNSNRPRLKFHV